jgi:hypothetical protein
VTSTSTPSRYRARRCDAVDRDGNRCELPFGHERGRTGANRHLVSVDDQPRVWTTQRTSSSPAGLRHYR